MFSKLIHANRSNRASKLIKRGWGTKDVALLCHASKAEIEQLRKKLADEAAAVKAKHPEPMPKPPDSFFEKPPQRVIEKIVEETEKAAEKPKRSKSYDPFARTIWE